MERTAWFLLCVAVVTLAPSIDAKTIPKAPRESKKPSEADIGKLFKGLPARKESPLGRHLETVIKRRLKQNPQAVREALLLAGRGLKKAEQHTSRSDKTTIPSRQHTAKQAPHLLQKSRKVGYRILDRVYWKDSIETLYGKIFKYAHRLGDGSNHGQALKKGYEEKLSDNNLKVFKKSFANLTNEQLKELFWKIHEAIKRGDITRDGKIIIDGKKYDLKKLASYCCPFG